MQLKNEFILACKDYFYLIEKGYSTGATLKIIGDHYKLSKIERNIILRGITTKKIIDFRKNKLATINFIKNNKIYIDGYNFIFTISNYFAGNFCFIAMDGFVRDCANIGGRNKKNLFYDKAVEILKVFFHSLEPMKICIFLDEPVSMSKEDAKILENLLGKTDINYNINLIQNPDKILSNINQPDIIITSDSVIIDKTNSSVFDIVRWYFEMKNIELYSLENIVDLM
ncbi:MAG: DUF434 domain-containing protein [Exilispira sp.]